MQAAIYERFGDASVLRVDEVATPAAGPGEVQVRVHVASLNPVDFKLRGGLLKLLGRPKRPAITGKDFAGTISALGPGVSDFSVGQRVFGSVDPMNGAGSCAEFVALSSDLVAATPEAVPDEVAACLPVAAGTALQALTDIAGLRDGQRVLIIGASGAVGAAGVQIARSLGARVSGVCGTANVEYVRGLGADPVIDYRAEDWRRRDARYDIVFDAAAMSSFAEARRHLAPRGWYINTMPRAAVIASAFVAPLLYRQRCVPFMLKTDAALLGRLAVLAAQCVLVPHIAEVIGLDQVAAAQARMEAGRVHGKICARVAG